MSGPSGLRLVAAGLFVLFGLWIAWRLHRGWKTGVATPLRGLWDGFERRTQPGLFWTTMALNTVVLVFVLMLAADVLFGGR